MYANLHLINSCKEPLCEEFARYTMDMYVHFSFSQSEVRKMYRTLLEDEAGNFQGFDFGTG